MSARLSESHLSRGGFPHSDICGSKLVCQLPAAFRRLPRPSSPVIAKASTSCTYSLDPITASTLRVLPLHALGLQGSHLSACSVAMHSRLLSQERTSIQSSNPAIGSFATRRSTPASLRAQIHPVNGSNRFTSSSLLKNSRLTRYCSSQGSIFCFASQSIDR